MCPGTNRLKTFTWIDPRRRKKILQFLLNRFLLSGAQVFLALTLCHYLWRYNFDTSSFDKEKPYHSISVHCGASYFPDTFAFWYTQFEFEFEFEISNVTSIQKCWCCELRKILASHSILPVALIRSLLSWSAQAIAFGKIRVHSLTILHENCSIWRNLDLG